MNSLSRPQPVQTLSVGRRMHMAWDLALSYMPLFMLSLLLLLSIWLVRNAPSSPQPEPPSPVSHTPDYEFTRFTLRSYDIDGRILSAMKGEQAQHFQDTLNTLVQQPDVWVFSDKRLTKARAAQALTNEDGSQVQLMGNAVVKRHLLGPTANTEEISSDFLHFFSNTDTLVTHLPVSITRGQDTFFADSLRADNVNQVLQLTGRVKVKLVPAESP